MKKSANILLSAAMAATLLVGTSPAALAAPAKAAPAASPSVFIDGTKLSFTNQQPVILKDRTLVPMRAIFEALGATIQYDAKTGKVTATKKDTSYFHYLGDKTVTLTIGSVKAHVKADPAKDYKENAVDKDVVLDVPAQTINDSTMVPLAFVGQALDCHVSWDGKNNRINIYKPQMKESWYQQDPQTDELTEEYDVKTYKLPDPLPTGLEEVFLSTVSYGDEKTVKFYSYSIAQMQVDNNGTTMKGDLKIQGVIDNKIWKGDYVLNAYPQGSFVMSIKNHIESPGYSLDDGTLDLRYIPLTIYNVAKDAYEKGLMGSGE